MKDFPFKLAEFLALLAPGFLIVFVLTEVPLEDGSIKDIFSITNVSSQLGFLSEKIDLMQHRPVCGQGYLRLTQIHCGNATIGLVYMVVISLIMGPFLYFAGCLIEGAVTAFWRKDKTLGFREFVKRTMSDDIAMIWLASENDARAKVGRLGDFFRSVAISFFIISILDFSNSSGGQGLISLVIMSISIIFLIVLRNAEPEGGWLVRGGSGPRVDAQD